MDALTIRRQPRPRLLVLSHVYPFPGDSGQQLRVRYMMRAFRKNFHLTFAGPARPEAMTQLQEQLSSYCDDAILFASCAHRGWCRRTLHRLMGTLYVLATGLKFSNYFLAHVEFTQEKFRRWMGARRFDYVMFEYWHASDRVDFFHARNIPCCLDMHNILWQSYASQLEAMRWLPRWWRDLAVARYKRREEAAWRRFDALVAINRAEGDYLETIVSDHVQVHYVPMGIDLALWPYCWRPASPPRIAYYGGLGSLHNRKNAEICYRVIMPAIWREIPDAEFWVVGSNPPDDIRKWGGGARVKVTGFVEDVKEVLKTMRLVLCPWQGTYGFRSRLAEIMALGVPVVASREAAYGMNLEHGRGILFGDREAQMIEAALALLKNDGDADRQSRMAREQIEKKYGFEGTYGRLADEFLRKIPRSESPPQSKKNEIGGVYT